MNDNTTVLAYRLPSNFLFVLVSVVVITCFNLPIAVANGELDSHKLPLNLELTDRFTFQGNTSSSFWVAQQDASPPEAETFTEITVAANEKGTESSQRLGLHGRCRH